MKAPLPHSEIARLDALRSYEVLDTPPEQAFDDFTALAAHMCQTPIALISLVDEDRQYFKSSSGLAAKQTARDVSFCAHAILRDELFVVPNALEDARFADSELVTSEPRIRFYAGAPLVTPQGHAVGTLCVMDRVPRELSGEQKDALRALGRQVVGQLELRRAIQNQKRMQEALAEANILLATKVTERTAEVERTGESLRAEIAGHRLTGATLRQTEELNRRMLASSRDCIKVLDLQGRVLSMNQHGQEAMEICDFEPLLHVAWPAFWPSAAQETARNAVATARDGGTARFQEFCPTAKGTPKWWDVVVTPILDADGKPELLLSSSRDITEQRNSAAALRESEERLETVVENISEGLVVSDLDGNLLHWNRAALEMLGFDSLAEVRRRVADLTDVLELSTLDGTVLTVEQWPLPRVIRGEQLREYVLHIRRRDTDLDRVLSCTGALVRDASGRPLAFVTFTDVTERTRVVATLAAERASLAQRVEARTADLSRANAELARAARLKDEFLANMSHELRTPLHAVLGMSEVLLEQLHGPLNERQQRYLTNVATSGRHLLALINDILDLSKIGAGMLELAIAPVPVAALCRASLQLVREAAHQKDIHLTSRVDEQLETLPGDERRLKQVLVNLLSNAVKFTPEHGAVGLDVEGDAVRQTIRFTVWDAGIGISPDDLPRLFQPFVQLDSGLARAHGGTGLGLALVYRMTEMHGGCVSVESEPGKGSRFTVSLPWPVAQSSSSPPACEPAHEANADFSKAKDSSISPSPDISDGKQGKAELRAAASPLILLAEDNEANITTLADYLQAKGCRLLIARNGREALAHAHSQRPDLVLMDIQMPVMDGLEVIRQMRADSDTRAVPIIALTALAMAGDRERCLAAGADEYVSKPFVLRELLASMNTLLRCKNPL